MLLAQVQADPFGGWGGLLLQGGAFVLLAYIVIVLAPRMFKESRDEREKRDALFQSVLTDLTKSHDNRTTAIIGAIHEQTDAMTKAMASVCQAAHANRRG
jgi:hypothetical protein